MHSITNDMLIRFRGEESKRKEIRTLQAAMAKTDLQDLAYVPSAAARLNGEFTVELKTRGITWQQKSGRCWLYAVMNILREKVAEKCGLEKFELSGNYLSFYDKLEKANNVLEMAIRYADRPTNDRMNEYILEGFGDGGYWDMAVDLVRKYGAVPQDVMPETWQSTHTDKFMKLLRSLLRKDIVILRDAAAKGGDVRRLKERMLEEVYRMECIAFGEPPEVFDFTWRDRDGAFCEDRDLTGKDFYQKYIGDALEGYITVTDHPTRGLKRDLYYKFHYIGSMAEGDIVNLNLTMNEMEELALKQLKAGEAVWFGCDSGAFGDRAKGIWDPDSLDYEGILGGIDLSMSKGDRLSSHDSYATHAMILVGVHLDKNGRPDRWKIENSWGEEAGRKGYFVCSEKYFREFVYEVIVRKEYLTPRQAALLEGEPAEIEPWESDWL